MTKRVIVFDLDDTVWDFNGPFSRYMSETTGITVAYDDIHTFDFTEVYGLPTETMSAHLEHFCHNHHANVPVYPESDPALERLSTKATLLAVTARKDVLAELTLAHLTTTGMADLFDDVLFTNLGSKLDICRKVNASAIIDDAPHNAIELAGAGTKAYMPKRPWNRHVVGNIPNLTPVSGIQEATLLLEQRFSL